MPILPAPKFIANSADGNHCGPAVWRMVLETYFPKRVWSFDEIDKIIRKEPGKYTWEQTFLPTMLDMGIGIHTISTWDDRQFIERTWDYVRETYNDEIAELQKGKAPELNFLLDSLKVFVDDARVERSVRPATLDDIQIHLREGAYVSCLINGKALSGSTDYSGHYVLVYGIDDGFIYLQDPGPNHCGSRKIDRNVFEKAWSYSTTTDARNLTAFYRPA